MMEINIANVQIRKGFYDDLQPNLEKQLSFLENISCSIYYNPTEKFSMINRYSLHLKSIRTSTQNLLKIDIEVNAIIKHYTSDGEKVEPSINTTFNLHFSEDFIKKHGFDKLKILLKPVFDEIANITREPIFFTEAINQMSERNILIDIKELKDIKKFLATRKVTEHFNPSLFKRNIGLNNK